MKNNIFIYKLVDPTTQEVGYVGRTGNITKRWYNHIDDSRRDNNSVNKKLKKWINGILDSGKKPMIEIIEECSLENCGEREDYWILYYLNISTILCNANRGGIKPQKRINPLDKSVGITEEGRKRMSQISRARFTGFTEEDRKRVLKTVLENSLVESMKLEPKLKRGTYYAIKEGFIWSDISGIQYEKTGRLRGEKHPGLKLKEEEIIQIKKLLNQGVKVKIIAKEYNVSQSHVYSIKNGYRR